MSNTAPQSLRRIAGANPHSAALDAVHTQRSTSDAACSPVPGPGCALLFPNGASSSAARRYLAAPCARIRLLPRVLEVTRVASLVFFGQQAVGHFLVPLRDQNFYAP